MRRIILALFSLVLFAACAPTVKKVKPPYCYGNQDCPEGFRCVDNICEDIYFPAKEVGQP